MLKEEFNKTEIAQIKSILGQELDKKLAGLIAKEVQKELKSNATESQMAEISANVLIKFYKILWMQRNFWSTKISRTTK